MKNQLLIVCALLLLAVSILALVDFVNASARPVSFLVFKDQPYAAGSTDPFQTLDLYVPKNHTPGPLPVIVWIHGGAWIAGDKNHPPAEPMLRRGYAVASVNYRLAPSSTFPAQIHDCKAAIRWLKANSAQFHLDADRFGCWGHSAGGHLAALVGTTGDTAELEGDLGNPQLSSRVKAICDWSGPSDLTSIAQQAPPDCKIDFRSPTGPVAALLGPNYTRQAAWNASPVAYISQGDPPTLIVHGKADDVVPVQQSQELAKALQAAGVKSECLLIDGEGHSPGIELVDRTLTFFDRHLKR